MGTKSPRRELEEILLFLMSSNLGPDQLCCEVAGRTKARY